MRTGSYKQAAATPGRAAATSKAVRAVRKDVTERGIRTDAVLMCENKDTKVSPESQQLSLFDAMGNAAAATNEMGYFFDAVRPHLEGLKASDRLSVLSCLFWAKAGEDRETLAGLLRKPLRLVFENIAKEVCHE